VLKSKRSCFLSTTLDILVEWLRVKSVILTGIAGNMCVLFTANGASMRDFSLLVTGDLAASHTVGEDRYTPEQMTKVRKARTRESSMLGLEAISR